MVVWMVSFPLFCVAVGFYFFIGSSFPVGIVCVCVCVCVCARVHCRSVPIGYSSLVKASALSTQWSWTSVDVNFLHCSSHTMQDAVNADTLPGTTVLIATLFLSLERAVVKGEHPHHFLVGRQFPVPSFLFGLRLWLFSLPKCDPLKLFFSEFTVILNWLPLWRFTSSF